MYRALLLRNAFRHQCESRLRVDFGNALMQCIAAEGKFPSRLSRNGLYPLKKPPECLKTS